MGYQPKSYRKFLATSVGAVMAASAVLPVAASAASDGSTSFTDVTSEYAPQVNYVVSKGIKGYPNGTFGVNGTVDREHAAVFLANVLGLDVPTSVTEKPFNDVPANATYAKFIKAVKDAGVFKGSNGNFGPSDVLTREAMASVIVNAYPELKDLAADATHVTVNDLSKADASHKANIQVLADLGITKVPGGNYNPKGNITRLQFASLLYQVDQAISNATPAVKSISAINAKKLEIKFNKEVNESEAESALNYNFVGMVDASGDPVTASTFTLQSDNKTVIVDLSAALANDTTFVATVSEIGTKADATVKTEKYTQTLKFSDTVRPAFSQVTYPAPGKAQVNFTEELSTIGTVKVYDGLTDVTSSVYTTAFTAGDDHISLSGLDASKTYKVVITGAKDQSGNLIAAPVEVNVNNSSSDTVAPTVTSLTANAVGEVKVQFSEGVRAISPATDLTVTVDGYDTTASTSQVFDATTNTMTITGLETAAATPVANNSVHAVSISGFEDLVGNHGSAYSKVLSFSNSAPKLQSTTVSKVGSDTYAVLTFDKDVTFSGDITGSYVTPDNIYKTVDSADITEATDVAATNNVLKVKVTGFEAGNYTLSLPAASVSNAGVSNTDAVSFNFALGASTDTTKPVVQNVYVPGETYNGSPVPANTVYVKYSKDMSQAALNTGYYTVDGLSVFKDAVFVGDKTVVKLTLKDSSIGVSGDRNFYISSNVTADNSVGITSYSGVETFSENVKPTLVSASLVDGDSVELTFSEYITDGTLGTTGDVEVYIDGVKQTISTISSGTANDNKTVLNLSAALTPTQLASSTVTVKVVDDATITDTATVANNIVTGTIVTVQK